MMISPLAGNHAKVLVAVMAGMLLQGVVVADPPYVSTKQYRGKTTAAPSEYSVSYGGANRRPRSYDLYYNRDRVGGAAIAVPGTAVYTVPALPPPPPKPVVIGKVPKYSAQEYSALITDLIEQDRANRALPTAEPTPESAKADTPAPEPAALPEHVPMTMAHATITSVTEDGTLITHEAGELRLRGLIFPDVDSSNEVEASAAHAIIAALRGRGIGKTLYYTTEEPLRDSKGRVMVIAHLADGTEVNRMLVESGLARVNPYDFEAGEQADKLLEAQALATKEKRGVWGE